MGYNTNVPINERQTKGEHALHQPNAGSSAGCEAHAGSGRRSAPRGPARGPAAAGSASGSAEAGVGVAALAALALLHPLVVVEALVALLDFLAGGPPGGRPVHEGGAGRGVVGQGGGGERRGFLTAAHNILPSSTDKRCAYSAMPPFTPLV